MRLEDGGRMWLEVTPLPSASAGREQALKVLEEAAEVFTEREKAEGFAAPVLVGFQTALLADEIADLITAACGLAESWGIDMEAAMDRCAIRNQERGRL